MKLGEKLHFRSWTIAGLLRHLQIDDILVGLLIDSSKAVKTEKNILKSLHLCNKSISHLHHCLQQRGR